MPGTIVGVLLPEEFFDYEPSMYNTAAYTRCVKFSPMTPVQNITGREVYARRCVAFSMGCEPK